VVVMPSVGAGTEMGGTYLSRDGGMPCQPGRGLRGPCSSMG
jgi:hypothetical protein